MASSLPLQLPIISPRASHNHQSPPHSDHHHTLRSFSQMLQSAASNGSLLAGKSVHARFVRTELSPDTHLSDSLINMYSKCRNPHYAHKVFDEMPVRDVVSYTALIAGYALENNGRGGVELFSEMCYEGIHPNSFALAACLKACSVCLDFEFGQQVHGILIKVQSLMDSFVGASLIDLYVKCGEHETAEKVFFALQERNVVSLNALLSGYALIGDETKVLKLFRMLVESEMMQVSKYTLSVVLKSCASLADGRYGHAIHSLMIKIGLEIDNVLCSNLIDLYSKSGRAWEAYKVFVKIKDPDVVLWTAMISCFNQQGLVIEAVELFKTMCRTGIKPNQFTLATVASVASKLSYRRFSCSVHCCIIKGGLEVETTVGNSVIDMYMNCEAVRDGFMVFDAMKIRDTISWNQLLSGYHASDCFEQALRVFAQMLTENYTPNMHTFISILKSCTGSMKASYGAQVHAHILKNKLGDDSFIGKSLVDMYANCRDLNSACTMFDKLSERDVFTWTLLISGFTKKGQGEKAIRHFRQMKREAVNPNEFTLASCLRACSELTSLETGSQFHSYVLKSGLSDLCILSALVDMYCKCGYLKEAEEIFDSSSTRDVVSWNTIICGYSQHGNGKKALLTFKSMINEGHLPDEVTFIGVLSACSHEGLVEDGKRYFDSMRSVYGTNPTIEHYACMIDLLCRAGKLDEAERFINRMNVQPNALIWQTVLAASKVHGNLKLGEKAAEKLFELEPGLDSQYVLLSNIYASCKRWDDVARVRAMMKSRGIKKEPGCSWIQVDGQVHVFLARDVHNDQMDKEIYSKLKRLTCDMSQVNRYIWDNDYVLDTC